MAHGDTPARAVRLIFEYDGDQVSLVSQQPVDMAVPSFDVGQQRQQPGVYVHARDDRGATLAAVPAPQAFSSSLEVFPEQPGEPIVRVDMPRPHGAFTVVVPASDAARQIAVVRVSGAVSPIPPGARADVAGPPLVTETELATFPLNLPR
jgi:hypothetical protein